VSECPSCGQPCAPSDAFCEACGTELAPAVDSGTPESVVKECLVCSADPAIEQTPEVTAEGYCTACGRKVPSGRDHAELDLGLIAGVTDRGLRHPRNEDAMALATASDADGPVAIGVVCDGVSSSPRSDEASLAAARAAVRTLLMAVRTGEDLEAASREAVRLAAAKLAKMSGTDGAPSATFISAVIDSGGVTLCWLGDSRAYWLASDGTSRRLSTDDSLAQEMVTSGMLNEAQAMASPHAHVITRWLGADILEPEAHVERFSPPGPGVLLVCSDGLWNYLAEAEGLAARALPSATTDPLGTAGELVKFAIDAGGIDNITVVLAPMPLRDNS
jgi:serine/threonine protein phosphatase PrpC